jgi:hypothetical protein
VTLKRREGAVDRSELWEDVGADAQGFLKIGGDKLVGANGLLCERNTSIGN